MSRSRSHRDFLLALQPHKKGEQKDFMKNIRPKSKQEKPQIFCKKWALNTLKNRVS